MAKQTVDYGVLAASTPVNAQAARDYNARGECERERNLDPGQVDQLFRLRDVERNGTDTLCKQPSFEDFTGRRIGRLTVVGRSGKKDRGTRWLVRCDCGRYEGRRTKTLKNLRSDRCSECDRLDQIRKGLKPPPNEKKGSTAT
jgi:hypothetical protein